jgi:hypothetical protein
MLGHLRTKTLDAFKDAFEKALARGDGFAVASRECTEAFSAKFDKGCEGLYVSFTNLIAFKLKRWYVARQLFSLYLKHLCFTPQIDLQGPIIKLREVKVKPIRKPCGACQVLVSAVYII